MLFGICRYELYFFKYVFIGVLIDLCYWRMWFIWLFCDSLVLEKIDIFIRNYDVEVFGIVIVVIIVLNIGIVSFDIEEFCIMLVDV